VKVIGYYSGGSASDTSDAAFSIGAIQVTSPNGGETWQAGSTYNITWTSTAVSGTVQIQPYLNGTAQAVIATSASNSGSYSWTIPASYTAGSGYTMSVSAMSGQVWDFSDSSFTISAAGVPTVTVSSPNGGETWGVGASNKRVAWTTSNGTFSSFDVQLSRDGGSSWGNLVTGLGGSAAYYDWPTVTGPGSANAMVRVIGYYAGGSVSDTSDAAFSIGAIQVTSPNGGETWQAGSTQNITWTSTAVSGTVQIQPYLNGTAQAVIATSASNSGSYSWAIPASYTAGSGYTMSVSAMSGQVWDFSDSSFTISAAAVPTVTVSSPNGGETWGVGASNKRVAWTTSNGTFSSFDVQLSRDGGGSWGNLVTGLGGSAAYYDWPTVTGPGSANAMVKVIGYYAGGSVNDRSDAVFSIGAIQVTSPNGGETWQAGSTQNITWTSTAVAGTVQIQPYLNGTAQAVITTSASNSGSYSWTIPSSYTAGSGYTMSVSAMSGQVWDFSDSSFTISAAAQLPDLTVGSVSGQSAMGKGAYNAVTVRIDRTGGALTNGTYVLVRVYLSSDATITSSDNQCSTDSDATAQFSNTVLNTSGTLTATVTCVPPASMANGTYYVGAIVDPTNYHAESNENNNSRAGATTNLQ
jgi:hypothetical protein